MEDRYQDIEQLFQESFTDFEPEVSDQVWANIQQGLNTTPAPGIEPGQTTGFWEKFGSTASVAITSAVVGVVIVAGVLAFNQDSSIEVISENKPVSPITGELPAANNLTKQSTEAVIHNLANNSERIPANETDTEILGKTESAGITAANENKATQTAEDNNVTANSSENTNSDVQSAESKSSSNIKAAPTKGEIKALIKTVSEEPSASIIASTTGGYAPLLVSFSNYGYAKDMRWDFGDRAKSKETDPTHTFDAPGRYKVTLMAANNIGQISIDTMTIEVLGGSAITSIPNVFTPNGDGRNDRFIIGFEKLESINVNIFDPAGNLVYRWNDLSATWDGRKLGGELAPQGTYYYILKAKGLDGNKYDRRSVITLLR